MTKWISAQLLPSPPMETVLLCIDGKHVMPGWNQSVHPQEDPAYCLFESWPFPYMSGDGVTHWMPLPEPPKETE
jgi:hypothetical protein